MPEHSRRSADCNSGIVEQSPPKVGRLRVAGPQITGDHGVGRAVLYSVTKRNSWNKDMDRVAYLEALMKQTRGNDRKRISKP